MKVGDNKLFILLPFGGLIDPGDTMDETIEKIKEAYKEHEIFTKKFVDDMYRQKLQKENPDCNIVQRGNEWFIVPKQLP